MLSSQSDLISKYPATVLPIGARLLARGDAALAATFVESGRIVLGIVGAPDRIDFPQDGAPSMEHQLGLVEGPAWLELNTVVLNLPSAVDAVAETAAVVRHVPLSDFHHTLCSSPLTTQAVLHDMARAHRRQTELAVSRLAMDAEARCAEWLLQHAESGEKGLCSVKLQQRKRAIAAQLGIAPETLSRVLRHLRERSLISGSGRVVNLVDLGGLRSLAER